MLSKSVGTIFPTAFAHFLSSCHILKILTIFKLFHSYYVCHRDLPSATFGVTVANKDFLIKIWKPFFFSAIILLHT